MTVRVNDMTHLQELGNRLWGLEEDLLQARARNDNAAAEKREAGILQITIEAHRIYQGAGGSESVRELAAFVAALGLRILGKWSEAIGGFEKVTSLNPANLDAWMELTWCCAEAGLSSEAAKAALQATRVRPDYAPAWYNLGVAFYHCKEREGSLEALREACRQAPNNEQFRAFLEKVEALPD